MKTIRKSVCLIFTLLLLTGSAVHAQSDEQKMYLGVGFGFDYGGLGGKFEYLPAKHIGVFGGLGYNLLSAGWNVGATYKILPDKKVSPNVMVFYGYNAVMKITNAEEYNTTSYGITIGGNLDIKVGSRGSKLSIGLFVPVRSSKFNDNYDAAKADSRITFENELLPIGFSIGYNFPL
ncbi:MAG: hypothetical protein LBL24_08500 [Bacteroidales bacterium]|jgi:hypothetical protein|nr:hypothetical protein [Bacteroidales bacterium]